MVRMTPPSIWDGVEGWVYLGTEPRPPFHHAGTLISCVDLKSLDIQSNSPLPQRSFSLIML